MRPRTLDEFVGQEHLLGPGRVLRRAIEGDDLPSMIFWGPPGNGKTSLARVIARRTGSRFVAHSAVLAGVREIRQVIEEARVHRKASGRHTILFVDEIHRFNRAQQDAFLPHVEAGTVVLIGATTENPSFEVNSALLSRTRVFVFEPLSDAEVRTLVERALADEERGLGGRGLRVEAEAVEHLVRMANGDGRMALNALEIAANLATAGAEGAGGPAEAAVAVTVAHAEEAAQRRMLLYDRDREEHYNIISALHKSLRGSDPQAGLYWLARMLEAGEDPLYIARRLIRFATEDVGMADPQALVVATAAKDAVHFIGLPEGKVALAEVVVYLAAAPKSNSVYRAYDRAAEDANETRAEPVPLHIRNAPTGLMKGLGYGRGYRYDHDFEEAVAPQDYLPENVRGRTYYEPTARGFEAEVSRRLDAVEKARGGKGGPPAPPSTPKPRPPAAPEPPAGAPRRKDPRP
jgi:putative ATPase